MPITISAGMKIYWDEEGEGAPVLLIMGLGTCSALWYRIRPALAARYHTIAFDNRGVGQSDIPPGPYSIPQMAADAAAVLDAANIVAAHVFGVSMGGMIAQEFALQYPNRVHSLILGCTSAGGENAVRADPGVLGFLASLPALSPENGTEAAIPFLHDSSVPRSRIEEGLALRRRWYPSPNGYLAQLQAIYGWEAFSRLHHIQAPTLIIHGDNDRLIPARNAEILAKRIPAAKLVLIPDSGHIFTTDQPDVSQREILGFLREQSSALRPAEHGTAAALGVTASSGERGGRKED